MVRNAWRDTERTGVELRMGLRIEDRNCSSRRLMPALWQSSHSVQQFRSACFNRSPPSILTPQTCDTDNFPPMPTSKATPVHPVGSNLHQHQTRQRLLSTLFVVESPTTPWSRCLHDLQSTVRTRRVLHVAARAGRPRRFPALLCLHCRGNPMRLRQRSRTHRHVVCHRST